MTPTTLPCSAGAVQSYHSNYGLREGKSLKRTLQTGPCLVSLARSYHKGKTSRLGFCKYNLPWVRKVGGRQFVVGESKCAYTAAVETEEAVDGASALDVATAVDAAPALSPEDEKLETDTGIGATPDNGDQANKKRAIKRPVRKITVKNEELIVGSVFTGIVKSIQPWGAFINIGAFADGLVHISKAGEGFVRNMEDVVKIGQEVKVKVIEVDMEQRRIKLSIKDVEKEGQTEPASERASSSRWGTGETATQRPRVQGRGSQVRQPAKQKPTTKFQKGQTVTGVVKNLTRRGGFVQLPGGEEGFLHSAEITPGGEDLPIENLLQVGQEVSVRILRITEGRLNLSMKTEVDLKKMNAAINDNEEAWATNPFELAFRKNPVIKQYLDETKKNTNTAETTEKLDGDVDQAKSSGSELKIENKEILAETSADEKSVELSNVTGIQSLESAQESQNVEESINSSDEEGLLEDSARVENTTMTEEETTEVDQSVDDNVYGKDEIREAEIESALESGEVESGDAILSDDKSKQPDAAVSEITAKLDEADEKLMGEVGSGDSGPAAEVSEKTPTEEDKAKGVDTAVSESSTELDEAAEKLSATATAVSAALVKQLREETGAGMMDCKKALTETGGNIERAYEYLRKKGLAGAEKKASRLASEGAVGSYIHDGRIGVLLEVNCETDFVSRGEIFKQLVDDLSMQIAANQQVAYVAVEDIPQELKDKEWAIEMEREDLQTKPEQVRVKIVEGRITKRLGDLVLLEQPFIKDDKVLVKDLIKQTVVTVGENIRVRRFARYVLGEGLEKREHDFVAEVAAQTKPKESIQGTSVEVKTDAAKEMMDEGSAETANGPSDIVISAAIVKQLREETGTGMMDCKKALLDTGGDYEKAREYLRKKGLASADKKASRVAAEGAVGSYIHDSRIGVLIEVNSETDFVARGEIFKQLLEDLAMQVVANPQVQFISVDDIPSDVRQKERELEMQREDLLSKPEQIREKIVDGRMSKRLGDLCLLEQPFIKDDSILVRDLIKQTIASIGENLKVRRFVRFTLGEGLEKKSQNFAAEVAAQIKG